MTREEERGINWLLTIYLIVFGLLCLSNAIGCRAKAASMPGSLNANSAAAGAAKLHVRFETINSLAIDLSKHVSRAGRQALEQIQKQAAEGKKDAAEASLAIAEATLEQAKSATEVVTLRQEIKSEREHYMGYALRVKLPLYAFYAGVAAFAYFWLANLSALGLAVFGGSAGLWVAKGLIRMLPLMWWAAPRVAKVGT
jgi:hypothetical protein